MTDASLRLCNTDPAVVKFFVKWCKECLGIPAEKFRAYLHLYNDMNINQETEYWSKEIAIPRSQFVRPYVKKSSQYTINHKGVFGHGTCNVYVGDAKITQQVLAGIKVVANEVARP